MERIKWLTKLADTKPLLFSLAMLLVAVSVLATVIANRESKLDDCEEQRLRLQSYYNARLDSLTSYYRNREIQLNEEVKNTLNNIIEDYKKRLEEQKNVNQKVDNTILNNNNITRKILPKTKF